MHTAHSVDIEWRKPGLHHREVFSACGSQLTEILFPSCYTAAAARLAAGPGNYVAITHAYSKGRFLKLCMPIVATQAQECEQKADILSGLAPCGFVG